MKIRPCPSHHTVLPSYFGSKEKTNRKLQRLGENLDERVDREGREERKVGNNCEERIRAELNSLSPVGHFPRLEQVGKRGMELAVWASHLRVTCRT